MKQYRLFFLICDSSAPWFAPFLDHTKPSLSEIEQNFPILSCTLLEGSYVRAFHSLLTVHDPIFHRNLGRRRSVNLLRRELRVLVLLQKHRLHGNTRKSFTPSVFLVEIGRVSELAALLHLLSCVSECACREVFSMQTPSSHQEYRSRGNHFALQSIARS